MPCAPFAGTDTRIMPDEINPARCVLLIANQRFNSDEKGSRFGRISSITSFSECRPNGSVPFDSPGVPRPARWYSATLPRHIRKCDLCLPMPRFQTHARCPLSHNPRMANGSKLRIQAAVEMFKRGGRTAKLISAMRPLVYEISLKSKYRHRIEFLQFHREKG
jgi:hypothetical protein